MRDRVLVTGISGFIAAHIAQNLLAKGYIVRGTVRSAAKGQSVADKIKANGGDAANLELVIANLSEDAGWKDAVKDCRYIQHIASPFPLEAPSEREGLVPEARAGAQRVLEHGLSAGADRIIMTSSMAAMMGQKNRDDKMRVSEQDWSDPEWRALKAYAVSKTRAEISAWAYVKAQNLETRLTTVCPGLVLGPDTYGNGGASLALIKSMFAGEFPMLPKLAYPIIDVRDCASIHVAAMTSQACGGRRLIAAGDTLWFKDIAKILRAEYPDAKKLPRHEIPNILVKFMSLFDDRLKSVAPDLGIFHEASAAYVNSLTGVIPRPAKQAILAAAETIFIT